MSDHNTMAMNVTEAGSVLGKVSQKKDTCTLKLVVKRADL